MNKLKDIFRNSIENKSSKTKLLVAIGIVGILLILLSEVNFTSDKKNEATVTKNDYSSYLIELTDNLKDIISSMDGVGECKVMITLRNTSESIYAKNTQNSQTDGSYSQNNEYVFYDGENGDSPILIQEKLPDIEGVAIVCSGGDNVIVKEKIIQCVSALFNISTNRISVSKLGS